jgi:putative flippase GtrA
MESLMRKFETAAPIHRCFGPVRQGEPIPSLLSPKPAGASQARPVSRSAFGSFARFVLFGGGVGLASSVAVPLVATLMPWAAANALITVASTLLGTELHARFTFGAGRRAQWHQHLQSAGSATAAYVVTSAAILVLHAVQPSASMRWEQAVYLGASGLAGIGRFLVLRLYVFARARHTEFDSVRPVRAGATPGGLRPSRGLPVPDHQRPHGRRPHPRPVVGSSSAARRVATSSTTGGCRDHPRPVRGRLRRHDDTIHTSFYHRPMIDVMIVPVRPADVGEILTLQRAAYVTEAQLMAMPFCPPWFRRAKNWRLN